MVLTLDASVWVAAAKSREPGYQSSNRLLEAIRNSFTPMVEPALLLIEVAAALSRTGTDPDLATEYAQGIAALPRLTLVVVDSHLASQAARCAAHHRLRGADAVYMEAASQHGATLVTLDREQLHRAPRHIRAATPADVAAMLA